MMIILTRASCHLGFKDQFSVNLFTISWELICSDKIYLLFTIQQHVEHHVRTYYKHEYFLYPVLHERFYLKHGCDVKKIFCIKIIKTDYMK